MQTLSYGFLLPASGDKGSSLWTSLESNIQKVNDHTHDGSNSSLISASHIGSVQQNILRANWASYGGPIGHYRQLVTMVPGFNFNLKNIQFRTAGGSYVYPTVEQHDSTSFYIYCTDNTIDLVANYGG